MEFDLEARLMGEALILNESQNPKYEDFIKVNDLNEPLELNNHEIEDLDLEIKEGEIINEPKVDVVKIRHDDEIVEKINEYPSDRKVYINYYAIAENMDAFQDKDIGDVIVGKLFCRVACVEAKWFDRFITIHDGNDSVTYQIARSHPRFKHLFNEQCNKIWPLLQVSACDILEGNSRCFQKLKGFKGVLNLGPEYIRNDKMVEWLTRVYVSMHEMD
ncbi:hypothetical protein Tco_1502013 [Tanacetum coccineum]